MTTRRNPDEQAIINFLEKAWGRKMTEQEINLALEQARAVGMQDAV
jgi:hypothetical protein